MIDGIMVSATIWIIGALMAMGYMFNINRRTKRIDGVSGWVIATILVLILWPHMVGYWIAEDD